jgi:uncharacterized RDD family membrane protein YckC
MDTSFSVPPPGHPLTAPAARTEAVGDLKRLDSKRVLARLLDGLLLLPISIVAGTTQNEGIYVPMLLATLIYFFLTEATGAQTLGKRKLGLRVMQRDGSAPTVNQVSVRTVLRLIDDGPIGALVIVLSGRRRQRIGDLLAGTTVGPVQGTVPRPAKSPLLVVYPAGWLIAAMVWFATGADARAEDAYFAKAGAICARTAEAGRTPMTTAEWLPYLEAQHAAHAALSPPDSLRPLHAELLDVERADLALGRSIIDWQQHRDEAAAARIGRSARDLIARRQQLADAGLRGCGARAE